MKYRSLYVQHVYNMFSDTTVLMSYSSERLVNTLILVVQWTSKNNTFIAIGIIATFTKEYYS